MNVFTTLYTTILTQPLFNLLVGITDVLPTHSIAWATIIVTLLVRLLLLPSSLHQARAARSHQEKMKGITGQLEEVKRKYAHDKAKQSQETMRLYKESGINPAAGCLPLLIQLPILIALYQVFFHGIGPHTYNLLYSFVPAPTALDLFFFGIALGKPNIFLAVLAGVAQFVQLYFFAPTPPTTSAPGQSSDTAAAMASMQKNMNYFFPVMTIFIGLSLPAALALYWVTTTAFGILQQYIMKRSFHLSSNVPAM